MNLYCTAGHASYKFFDGCLLAREQLLLGNADLLCHLKPGSLK